MVENYKALIAVIVITVPMFMAVRPLMRRFMSDADFVVRRNLWLTLTVAAFVIPDYWTYVAVASVAMLYAVRRDSNPAALYLFLLLAMVPIGLNLPTFGFVRQLLFIDHLQLLSLVVLLPVALRIARRSASPLSRQPDSRVDRVRKHADGLILLFLALQIGLLFPFESITATLRRVVVSGTAIWLPYYVLSRACRSREQLVDAMAAFVLAMLVLTPLAVFEVFKGWLLYAGLENQWNTAHIISYLRRGAYLRGQVTAGHSIVLGFAMTIGFGFWLYLQSRIASAGWRWAAMGIIVVGMAAPSARGPWLGALVLLICFFALGPNRGARIVKLIALSGIVGAVLLASPYGAQVVDRLPFVGTLDEGTVTYRQQLMQVSWSVILQNPWFGTPGFLAYLEELRQGQGIIDLVNAYAGIALAYGLLTLAAFVALFALIVVACLRDSFRLAGSDPGLSLLGVSMVACLVSALTMIATVNLYLSVAYLVWSLAGLGVAYAQVARRGELADTAASPSVAPVRPWAGVPAHRSR